MQPCIIPKQVAKRGQVIIPHFSLFKQSIHSLSLIGRRIVLTPNRHQTAYSFIYYVYFMLSAVFLFSIVAWDFMYEDADGSQYDKKRAMPVNGTEGHLRASI